MSDMSALDFAYAFRGENLSLTGLAFWADSADMFLPKQHLHLWVRNCQTGEVYELDDVVVAHVQKGDNEALCGCFIRQMSSEQLLAHTRNISQAESKMPAAKFLENMPESLDEFHFSLNILKLTQRKADIQEVAMLIEMAIERIKSSESASREEALAILNLAKLVLHQPEDLQSGLLSTEWQGIVRDFEQKFFNERVQTIYDFLHQGMSIEEAIEVWNKREYRPI